MMQSKPLLIGLWAGLAALACLSGFVTVWPINQWSLAYLGNRLDSNPMNVVMAAPPENHPHAGIWLARDALRKNDPIRAYALVETLADQGDKNALIVAGNALAARGDFDGALNSWILGDQIQPLFDAAHIAKNEGQLDDVLKAYKAAYKIDPDLSTIRLAHFLWKDENNAVEAEAILRYSLDTLPHSKYRSDWFTELGVILRDQKRWDETEIIYTQWISEDNENWKAYIELGWLLYERGDDIDHILDKFQMAIEVAPEKGDGYFAKGELLAKEGHYEEADKWYSKALELSPDIEWWYVRRADRARDGGDLSLAISVYNQAIELFPNFAFAYNQLAWAYYLENNIPKAVETIEQAHELYGQGIPWYSYLRAGLIYESANDIEKAITAYRKTLEISPDIGIAKEGLERLIQE